MRRFFLFAFLLVGAVGLRAGGWVLDSSTLTYRVTHRLHKVEGTSHGARGKGLCDGSGCRFLVAAPVNTFDSGDSNRDLHMIETTRGAQFPMVKVSVNLAAVQDMAQNERQLGVVDEAIRAVRANPSA
ncbi:MAG TPA: hypothetical protein PKA08_07495, partial [Elusimicrobiota bacterium]|nr:hypothetical protein [Elusimicrobiota bacterium]